MSDTQTVLEIPVPEPNLTADELVARARGLREHLRAEQAATETRGAYSPETHELFREAGFYRTLLPRRFGGHEFDVTTFMKMVVEIARGCPGTGWCLCLASGHGIQLGGLWNESVQRTVLTENADFCAPLRALPMGTAARTAEGGWRIDGKWDYCSGSPYSTYAMLSVRLDPAEANGARLGVALVPRADWNLLDDWKDWAVGMRGSGSNSIEISGAVIPDDFLVRGSLLSFTGEGLDQPGYEIHGNPMYAGLPMGYLQLEITSILVGTTYAALDEYERIIRERKTMGPNPVPRFENSDYQRHWGLASGKLLAAEAVLMHNSDYYSQLCREAVQGAGFDTEKLMTIHAATHHAINLAWEAMEILYRTGGTSEGGRQGTRMERYWRDFSTARTNAGLSYETFAQTYAKQHFGIVSSPLI